MAVPMAFDQSGEGLRFFERRQAFALEVLDQRNFQVISAIAHDRGQTIEPREAGSPEAPLSRQELRALPVAPANDGLEQAAVEKRGRQRTQPRPGAAVPRCLRT